LNAILVNSKNIETKEEKVQKKQSQEQGEQGQTFTYNEGRQETWKKKTALKGQGSNQKGMRD